MRVAFDVSILGRPRPTGTERAATTLIDAILATDEDLELHLLAPDTSPFSGDFGARHAWRDDPRVVVAAGLGAAGTGGRPWLWRESTVPGLLRQAGCSVWHAPVVALPLRTGCRCIATVHEIPWAHRIRGGDKRLAHRVRMGLAATRAWRLLCVSQRTADDLVRLHAAAADRVVVVPHGVDPVFTDTPTVHAPGSGERPRVLVVGRQRRKKNLARVLEALGDPALGEAELILAGPEGGASAELRRRAEDLERQAGRPRVRFIGHVTDEELVAHYDEAAVVVFPSLLEGFGLPVVEAMARGTPVLVAEQGAVDEAVGDAAGGFDGGDVSSLVAALRGVLEDPARATQLADAGRRHAAGCRADRAARAVLDLWRVAADES